MSVGEKTAYAQKAGKKKSPLTISELFLWKEKMFWLG